MRNIRSEPSTISRFNPTELVQWHSTTYVIVNRHYRRSTNEFLYDLREVGTPQGAHPPIMRKVPECELKNADRKDKLANSLS